MQLLMRKLCDNFGEA